LKRTSLADCNTLVHTEQETLTWIRDELRFVLLSDFKDVIGTENIGNHYWYTWHGDPCRGCGGAPQSVGELFLAVYSEGQWYCNLCYTKNPVDPKGQWHFMPANDDEDDYFDLMAKEHYH
jgi:hypothetical protein